MEYVINVGHTKDDLEPVCACMSIEHGKRIIEANYQEYPYQEICYSPENMSADEVVWRNW